MKQEYQPPALVEYGPADQLTLGATGTQWDINIIIDPHNITINANPSDCQSNVGSGGCFKIIWK
ncbi:MAG TPA: lasso RiPP family leader peptide-containing protein [Thermomicrobiales bacterium]|nr:lasso RiPP family leader peptide-containing protein [Thermomicrobiales bacterium]